MQHIFCLEKKWNWSPNLSQQLTKYALFLNIFKDENNKIVESKFRYDL
jgi:hypothetical protein